MVVVYSWVNKKPMKERNYDSVGNVCAEETWGLKRAETGTSQYGHQHTVRHWLKRVRQKAQDIDVLLWPLHVFIGT